MKIYSRRSRFLVFITIFLVFTIVFAVCGGKQEASAATPTPTAKTYTLRVADSLPNNHYLHRLYLLPWMKKVTELTNGQVKFEHYPAEQISKQTAVISNLNTKVIDMGYLTPSFFTGELPLSTVTGLPGIYPSATVGCKAYMKMLASGPLADEFKRNNAVPVFGGMLPPQQIMTSKKPIAKVEDVKGMKIRVPGTVEGLTIRSLGGVPVTIPGAECYTALERGTVDGMMGTIGSINAYKFDEVMDYSQKDLGFGGFPWTYSIRADLWNELPQNVKDAMTKAAIEINVGPALDALDDEVRESVEARKTMTFISIPKAERARFVQAARPVWDKWASDMKAKGLDGQTVLDTFIKNVNEASSAK